ncbi:branched-chain amino acid ABC transporter permease [Nocardioides sp. zg-ZUI104]|uniref:branched-chain amino acid ABC transporter permease n=1 Tax=Nocardioides faecalis TaxID=2803858 RepID=UPI001BCC9DAE|nr:branched-chain amino acid ABC transporter permease [Nocardioides faecalis]MBS4751942.1 branched-chain amino acid ABC transporter permease [Nocardioides faecalis]
MWWHPLLAAALAVLLLVWMSGSGYREDLLVLACTYALVALGMYLPFVMAGSLSMAYSAYAAIGAYSVGLVSSETGWPVWVGWLAGALVAGVVAVVLSLSTRRLSGFYLAAVTLLFGTAFEKWLTSFDFFGGPGGIGGIRPPSFFGHEPSRGVQVALAMTLVIVVATLLERARRSPVGAVVRAMGQEDLPVEASGVRTADLTSVCLAVGAAIASTGGSLFASFVGGVTPETFTLAIVFLAVFMPLIGGRGTAWGAVVGAVLVVEFSLNLDLFETSGQLILAIAVLVILLVAPAGVLGYLGKARVLLPGRRVTKEVRR